MAGSSHTAASGTRSCKALLLTVFTLWACAGAFLAKAGDNTWTPLGPDGGYISKVVFHNTVQTIVYARASGGFFRSTDGGAHWQQPEPRTTAMAQDFAVDPTDGNRVYLVNAKLPSRVLISTDAGVTFSTYFTFPSTVSTPSLIAVSTDGNTLYAICDKSVFRSTNRGSSWQQGTDFPTLFGFGSRAIVDPTDASTLYVVRTDQLLVTRNGGGTWANIAPVPSIGVDDLAVDPTTGRLWAASSAGIRTSTDGGASWSVAHADSFSAVALDPQAPATVYAGKTTGEVLKRTGATWNDITSNLGSFAPRVIAVGPQNGARLAVANVRGLWATTNSGGSWARSDAGLVSTAMSRFSTSASGHRVYAQGNALATFDDGSDVVTEIEESSLFDALGAKSSFIGPLTPVIDAPGGLLAAVTNRIGRSLDNGVTWSITGYVPASNDAIVDLVATTTPPSVYYASSVRTLQRSVNQGVSWTAIVTGLPAGQSPGLIAIAPSNPSVLYAGPRSTVSPDFVGSGVYKSTNGGDTWVPVNTGIEDRAMTAIAIHPTNPDIVYVGTSFYLMKTVNGGGTWTSLPWSIGSPVVRAIAIDPRAPDTVYAAGDLVSNSEVARSTNGGATWTHLATPANFPWGPAALSIDTTRQDTIRVGTGTGGIRQMTVRADLQPDLAIEVSPSLGDIPLLAPTQYTFKISNLGPGPAGSVTTQIQVPANVTGVAATPSSGTCTVAGSSIDCSAPALNASATLNVVVSVTPTVSDFVELTGSVRTDALDAQPGNDTTRFVTFAREQADLSLALTGPTSAQTGESLQYKVTITNSGPSPATGVTASAQLPGGMTQGTFTSTAGTCSAVGVNGLACDIGSLASGATVTLTMNGTVAAAGSYLVTAGVMGKGNDGASANNQGQVSTSITAPPAPPPPPSNSGGSSSSASSGGGGGAISPLMLLGLLLFFLGHLCRVPRVRTSY